MLLVILRFSYVLLVNVCNVFLVLCLLLLGMIMWLVVKVFLVLGQCSFDMVRDVGIDMMQEDIRILGLRFRLM